MARFLVDHTAAAEHTLATFLAGAPVGLRRQITDACDEIDSKLTYADLLPNYRRTRGLAPNYVLVVFPLRAIYEVDSQTKTVTILQYEMAPQLHSP